MDSLDRKLIDAWQHTRDLLMQSEEGQAEARRRFDRFARSQLVAPLRSWSLVLRAADTRITSISDLRFGISDVEEQVRGESCVGDGVRDRTPDIKSRILPGIKSGSISGNRDSQSEVGTSEIEGWHADGPYNKVTGQLLLTRSVLEALCRPVSIAPPGVEVNVAAARLGVSRQTVWRWMSKADSQANKEQGKARRGNEHVLDAPFWVGRVRSFAANGLVKELYANRADRKRDEVRYWTASPIDPGGLIAMGDWGSLRSRLLDKFKVEPRGGEVADEDDVQVVTRAWRDEAGRHGRWQWVCPGNGQSESASTRNQKRCEPRRAIAMNAQQSIAHSQPCLEYSDKLYWPLPVWTIPAMFDADAAAMCRQPLTGGFVCRNCAGLVYESSEAHWGRGESASQRKQQSESIAWRRFVQRMSAGMVGQRAEGNQLKRFPARVKTNTRVPRSTPLE